MTYTVLESIRNRSRNQLREQFCLDVLIGFSAEPKFLPSKYFYDERGSRLFEQITSLEEYYPTRCEFEILDKAGPEIAAHFGDGHLDVVELGAGDGRKTRVLLERLMESGKEFSYIPVDISESAVADLVGSLLRLYRQLPVRGVVGEYFDSMQHLETVSRQRKLVLFLGSNIGNFDYLNALRFLRTVWKRLNDGDLLLIGFDLKKDIDVMLKAYNDPRGVTRAFNLNVLRRVNEELEADFDLDRVTHHGLYNPLRGAMESYLISLEPQEVAVRCLRKTFRFEAYEPIHLEYSYKYLLSDIESMAADTGFEILRHWQDSRGWFADSLWRVRKEI